MTYPCYKHLHNKLRIFCTWKIKSWQKTYWPRAKGRLFNIQSINSSTFKLVWRQIINIIWCEPKEEMGLKTPETDFFFNQPTSNITYFINTLSSSNLQSFPFFVWVHCKNQNVPYLNWESTFLKTFSTTQERNSSLPFRKLLTC